MRRKSLKIIKYLAIAAGALVTIVVVGALGLRAYFQHAHTVEFAINTPNGIQEGMYVPIGGIDQWVQIRGGDRDNPVLLYVHGGPGGSVLASTLGWRPWEKSFTVVQWDQRGAGRTYRKNGSAEADSMTIDRMVKDGIEVTEFLRTHLHKDKIILVAHSWGSILGVHMIKEHPELFAAYVGTGQVVDMRKNEVLNYAHVMAQAEAAHNSDALAALEKNGPPPYDSIEKFGIERHWADILAAGSGDPAEPTVNASTPGFTLMDMYYQAQGFDFSQSAFFDKRGADDVLSVDLTSLGPRFDVPVFLFMGTEDQQTPIELAEQYFEWIDAPHKEFVEFRGDHHFVALNRPDEFLKELVARVRPWTDPAH
jgi:pimeloyl-ACP methyl ester carboxylesterase